MTVLATLVVATLACGVHGSSYVAGLDSEGATLWVEAQQDPVRAEQATWGTGDSAPPRRLRRRSREAGHAGFAAAEISGNVSMSFLQEETERGWAGSSSCVDRPSEPAAKAAADVSVFVVMPGLGNPDHLHIVKDSVAWLRKQEVKLDCLVYVYNRDLHIPGGDESLQPCKVNHATGQWTHFLQEAPESAWSSSDYVLVWFDDVRIDQSADLRKMTEVMRRNKLGVASPSYDLANSQNRWFVMKQEQGSHVGRYTNLVEYQFTLMTPDSFRCLRKMIEPATNPRGWGLDRQFVRLCPNHCLGVLDMFTIQDTSSCSYGCEKARTEMQAYTLEHGEPPEPRNFGYLEF